MVQMGDTREGTVYTAVAGPYKIVLQDTRTAQPGPQPVIPVMGTGAGGGTGPEATMSFFVNGAEERQPGLVRDDAKPHAVTLGPRLKTAEANGTFMDFAGGGTPAVYAVSVRFACN
jgi:hypothetical protein